MKFLKNEVNKILNLEIYPNHENFVEAIKIFMWWSAPAFTFVLAVNTLSSFRSVEYYLAGVDQGIGPMLWNIFGIFGLMFFSLSLVFPNTQFFSRASHQILLNTFAMGSLAIGLLLGSFFVSLPTAHLFLEGWRLYFFGPVWMALLIIVALINFAVWYISQVTRPNNNYQKRISEINVMTRTAVALLFFWLPVVLLWLEK